MDHPTAAPLSRRAQPSDLDGIVETLTSAFFDDPVWAPAFPDIARRAGQAAAFWRLLVTSSFRYPSSYVTENTESVAIWIPPHGVELTQEEDDGFEDFLAASYDSKTADTVREISEAFLPHPEEPHYYLSLLGTHSDHRGHGTGMALLRECLDRIDAEHTAAYLESTNPANLARYQSVGFEPREEFLAAGQTITTMWRPAR